MCPVVFQRVVGSGTIEFPVQPRVLMLGQRLLMGDTGNDFAFDGAMFQISMVLSVGKLFRPVMPVMIGAEGNS